MEVYKKVRAYIEGSGCGQFAVAQKAGIPQVDFDAMMNGEKPCTPMTCAQFVSP